MTHHATSTGARSLIFGREPAAYIAIAQALVAFVSMFLVPLSTEQGATLIAVVNAVLGLVLALRVRPIAPAAFTALVQAVVALLVGFGLNLSTDQQGVLLTITSVLITFVLVRPQVTPVGSVATQSDNTVS